MRIYFQELHSFGIPTDLRKDLAQFCHEHFDRFRHHETDPYNMYLPRQWIPKDKIFPWQKKINIFTEVEFIGQASGAPFFVHTDDIDENRTGRRSAIICPLFPIKDTDFHKTYFFEQSTTKNLNTETPGFDCVATLQHSDTKAYLVNLQKWHSSYNPSPHMRVTLQFSIAHPYGEVLNLFDKGQLVLD